MKAKTKAELIKELEQMRRRAEELEAADTERKQTEVKLKAAEERYRTLFHQSPDAVVILDPETTTPIEFNNKVSNLLGYSSEEFSHLRISDYEASESPEEIQAHIKKILLDGADEFETRMLTKEGEIRDVLVSIQVMEIGGQTVFHNIFHDITERKRAEEKLKSSHERFLTVMDSLDALVYVAGLETFEILFINQYGREIFGDLVGEACWQTLQVDQTGPCAFCSNDKLLTADGEPAGVYEWEFQNTLNDRWYEIRDRAIRWVDGRLVRLEIAMDITERKRAEEDLRALKALKDNVVRSMQEGLVALDRDFCVTLWNEAMEEISGYAAEEVLGQVVYDVFPHLVEQGVDKLHRAALRGEAAERLNVPYQTPKGKEGYTNERYAPLKDHAGEVIGVVAVVEDVTELLRLEKHVANLQEEIRQRKLIDIAKDILVRERGMSIAESHSFIINKSRAERVKAVEIARQLIVLLGTPEERKKFTQRNPG